MGRDGPRNRYRTAAMRQQVCVLHGVLAVLAGQARGSPPARPSFEDERGQPVNMMKEAVEHCLIAKHIPPYSQGVLELGARYGTSSCAISKQLARGGAAVVSAEADPGIWPIIERNLLHNRCGNHLVKGVVARKPMFKSKGRNGSGWTTKFKPAGATAAPGAELSPAHTPESLASRFGLRFDAMVVDCEGCFAAFLKHFGSFVESLDTVILEADYGIGMQRMGYANYTHITQSMSAFGFIVVESFGHPCCSRKPNMIPMMVFRKRTPRVTGSAASQPEWNPPNRACARAGFG